MLALCRFNGCALAKTFAAVIMACGGVLWATRATSPMADPLSAIL